MDLVVDMNIIISFPILDQESKTQPSTQSLMEIGHRYNFIAKPKEMLSM